MLKPSKTVEWILKSSRSSHIFSFLKRHFADVLIVAGISYIALGFWPIISAELNYFLLTKFPAYFPHHSETTLTETEQNQTKSLWNDIGFPPINTEFSVIIPKIGVNAPIVADVPTNNPIEYLAALERGVAHANSTTTPSPENGNTYLFAHSTPNPAEIQEYSAVFTLLNKLNPGEKIIIFYQNQRYDYIIQENIVVEAFNLSPLTREVHSPTLTLQTCDPPGIPINRRIVTAELEEHVNNM